jgi:Ca2+:H+ antiporter
MVIDSTETDKETRNVTILNLSRGTAVLLLVMYCLYLWFQLRTHHNLFTAEEAAVRAEAEAQSPVRTVGNTEQEEAEAEEEERKLNTWAAAAVLIATTVLVAICADYLVDSIDALVERAHLSRNFIGLILIPIVGNAAEHVTAVVVAVKNKMDLVSQHVASLSAATISDYRHPCRLWESLSAQASRSPSSSRRSWSSWAGSLIGP